MLKFKVGDSVKITSGKDKDRVGKIEKLFPTKQKALVPGVNIYKKHVKGQLTADGKGGIFDIPRPLPFSKFALLCPKCKKMTRVGFRIEGNDKETQKTRYCKKCNQNI